MTMIHGVFKNHQDDELILIFDDHLSFSSLFFFFLTF
jgi:hypothetical protein